MKLLQINSTLNTGSTGCIAEGIGKKVIEAAGGQSYIAYGRAANPSLSLPIKIGGKLSHIWHLLNTRLFDTHGFHSTQATKKLIEKIEKIDPDIIHLHNLHGYYLNVRVLFQFLKDYKKPVVWTLHDCWSFTGHCCHYERVKCKKWKAGCHNCPLKFLYPKSYGLDNSKKNYHKKKSLFNSVENLNLVTVSKWLKTQVQQSFLHQHPVRAIYNGIDLQIFKPKDQEKLKTKYGLASRKVIVGVANEWSVGKGLHLFLELAKLIPSQVQIVLVGIKPSQSRHFPENITAIHKTKNKEELADVYALADVFVTPSIAETFGMVAAEALACGTPCVVNNTSALPELVDDKVGLIVNDNSPNSYLEAIMSVFEKGKEEYENNCTSKARQLFGIEKHQSAYYDLYRELLNQ